MSKDRLHIPYPVIVEGKYDKIRLSNIIEGNIITTDGFGIFKQDEKKLLIRRLSEITPLILLTDSDGGGKIIRSHLTGMVPRDRLIQLYIPQIHGKERRKTAPSAAGTLGVEGMRDDLLRQLLAPYADGDAAAHRAENPLTKKDLYIDGLTGGANASAKRDALCVRIGLPRGMTSGALLEALRMLYTYEQYLALVGRKAEE